MNPCWMLVDFFANSFCNLKMNWGFFFSHCNNMGILGVYDPTYFVHILLGISFVLLRFALV